MSPLGLSLVFMKIAVFTFGGGYAMVPLFESEIVVRQAFLSSAEFANLVGLAQVTPGPVGFNAATYVGLAQGGFAGALAASLGVMVPSLVLALVSAVFLRRMSRAQWLKLLLKGVRPCVVGIIASAVVFFADTSVFTVPVSRALRGDGFGVCWQGALIFALVLAIRWRLPGLHPVFSLAISAALGYLLFL